MSDMTKAVQEELHLHKKELTLLKSEKDSLE